MHPAIPATASSNLEFIREGLPGAAFSNLTAAALPPRFCGTTSR
jgi:hypothetical protein